MSSRRRGSGARSSWCEEEVGELGAEWEPCELLNPCPLAARIVLEEHERAVVALGEVDGPEEAPCIRDERDAAALHIGRKLERLGVKTVRVGAAEVDARLGVVLAVMRTANASSPMTVTRTSARLATWAWKT